MSAWMYEQLLQALRQHDPKGAPSIEEALSKGFRNDDDRRDYLIQRLGRGGALLKEPAPMTEPACSLTYEQLVQALREHDPKGAPALEEALRQIYRDNAERRVALIRHLQQHRALPEESRRSDPALTAPPVADLVAAQVTELGGEPPAPEPAAAALPTAAKPERRAATGQEQAQRIVSWLFKLIDELSPVLPPEVFVGYLQCWRLADWKTGEFYVSHERMAERLGAANRSTSKRVMKTLRAAGLVRIKVKGKTQRATLYRLAPREAFDPHRLIAAVVSTWQSRNPRMLKQAEADETGSRETR